MRLFRRKCIFLETAKLFCNKQQCRSIVFLLNKQGIFREMLKILKKYAHLQQLLDKTAEITSAPDLLAPILLFI